MSALDPMNLKLNGNGNGQSRPHLKIALLAVAVVAAALLVYRQIDRLARAEGHVERHADVEEQDRNAALAPGVERRRPGQAAANGDAGDP